MITGIGITQWEAPFQGPETLCSWARNIGLDTVSMEFDAEACEDEESTHRWAMKWKRALEENSLSPSILAVNVLCDIGMGQKENEEECGRILDLALYAAHVMQAPAVHLPSFFSGEIRTEEELEQTIRILRHAVKLGEKYGVLTGHEAVLDDGWYDRVLEDAGGSGSFFMLFDNENLAKCGIDPLAVWERYHQHMPHAHLKHADAQEMPHPICEDTRFGGPARLLGKMKEDAFSGWIILESYYKKAGTPEEAAQMIGQDVRYVKSFFEE